MDTMVRGAALSNDGLYRYVLQRTWHFDAPLVAWVMLNPSTADASYDDPTIRKCVGFTKQWAQSAEHPNYGGLVVINLFAWRATKPNVLWDVRGGKDITGPDNDDSWDLVLNHPTKPPALIVAAWGGQVERASAIAYADHTEKRLMYLRGYGAKCLGRTKAGSPRHPLMLPYVTPLEAA